MTPANLAGQLADTKVFVGGLPWETHKDTLKKYFEQFGEILEAVVITDKATRRSKGYGFVTFREADAAMRACENPSPVIDGRKANCNLASLGVQRSKPSTPKHGEVRNLSVMRGFHHQGGIGFPVGAAFTSSSSATFPHMSIQQGVPYHLCGYLPYSAEYAYPTSYYGVYRGMGTQYQLYGSGSNGLVTGGAAAAYHNPYLNFNEGMARGVTGYSSAGQGGGGGVYGVHYPNQHHHFFQYSTINSTAVFPSHYAASVSLAHPTPIQSGVIMDVPLPIPHR